MAKLTRAHIEENMQIEIPNKIDVLANVLNEDLYSGPVYYYNPDMGDTLGWGEEPDPDDSDMQKWDFSKALAELKDWADDNLPSQVYLLTECGNVTDREPEAQFFEDEDGPHWQKGGNSPEDEDDIPGYWCEPEEYYAYDYREILATLWGEELARSL